ncbi:MAG TPA: outer membrane protein assembly factor BamD, partial [Terriglobales bacterium]|nr:outer membrane protein assembly factor BamD [Terriglobales bacterium]
YPDNQKMVEEARKRLLQVQEVIAEREYRVGKFYFLKSSYPAAIARLQSLVDRYPLYSKADETLYLLGQSYEGEIAMLRKMDVTERQELERLHKVNEAVLKERKLQRERMISDFAEKAAAAYSKIITRYPAMDRADDARMRLAALHQPIPRPTKAALALNKAEEAGRGEQTMLSKLMSGFAKHPDTSSATKIGAPTLTDPNLVSASDIVQRASRVASGTSTAAGGTGNNSLSVQAVGTSDSQPPQDVPTSFGSGTASNGNNNGANGNSSTPDPNELKPTTSPADSTQAAAPDPNELTPTKSDQPAPPPAQVNELQPGNGGSAAATQDPAATADGQQLADDKDLASSKHKKKKGLHKIIPFN